MEWVVEPHLQVLRRLDLCCFAGAAVIGPCCLCCPSVTVAPGLRADMVADSSKIASGWRQLAMRLEEVANIHRSRLSTPRVALAAFHRHLINNKLKLAAASLHGFNRNAS